MSVNDNTVDNNSALNQLNNESLVITLNRDNSQNNSRKSSNKTVISQTNIGQKTDISIDNQTNGPQNKSSNRNAINFMGYFILVLVIFYGYFGSLLSDMITNSNNGKVIVKQNQSVNELSVKNETKISENVNEFKTNDKFYRNITSTELIVILWLTIIYGSALLLYLRFRVLKLERDPNSEKKKKKDNTEELDAFMANNRKNRKSFREKFLNTSEVKPRNDSNQPFWQK